MLKNNKLIFDFKEEIKTKYGYDEELAETIAMTAESLIDYMGEEYESVILEAIGATKYVIANDHKLDEKGKKTTIRETIYDVLNREGMLEGTDLSEENLKRAKSAYVSVPRLSYKDGKFSIDEIDHMICLSSTFNPNSPASLAVIARETMSLVKSYKNEYQISQNSLIKRNGLSTANYELEMQNGSVTKKLIQKTGEGLEAGINAYDELCLVREMYENSYEVYDYAYQRIVASFLADSIGLRQMIKEAEITGDVTELKAVFDQNMSIGYEGFLSKMDKSIELERERSSKVLDDAAHKESIATLERYFTEELVPIVHEFGMSVRPEMRENYGFKKIT